MKTFIALSLLISIVAVYASENWPITTIEELAVDSETRIINGKRAVPGQFPHQVYNLHVKGNGQYICGGSLICDSWVLTAGHCAQGVSKFTLSFGAFDRNNNSEPGRVNIVTRKAHVHPKYNATSLENDVALVYVGQKLNFSKTIQPISLGKGFVPGNVQLTVSGWGKTSDAPNTVSQYLNYVKINSVSNNECKKNYLPGLVVDSTLCCKGSPNQSSCNGDSGGPLIRYIKGKPVLVGVVSFVSNGGCSIGRPSGYARVTSFTDWIVKTINGSCKISKA